MLKKFELEDSKPTKTPMSTEIKLTKDDEADSVDSSKYREEDDDMKVDIEEDENELELTYPYEEVDPLNPPPPASDSEPEDVIEVEDTIESEDETVPDSVHKVGESSTAPFLREDSDGLFPGLMRRDINSLFVRSSVEQGMTAMEKLVEKLGNAREKAECEKLKKELEKARFPEWLGWVVHGITGLHESISMSAYLLSDSWQHMDIDPGFCLSEWRGFFLLTPLFLYDLLFNS
ncbi:hypothetical protein Tco_0485562 [Tanacetum coccineum]